MVADDQVTRVQMAISGSVCDLILKVIGAPCEFTDDQLAGAGDLASSYLEAIAGLNRELVEGES